MQLQTDKSSKKPKVTDELLADGREGRTPTRSSHMITGGRGSQLTGVEVTVQQSSEGDCGAFAKSRLRLRDLVPPMPCLFIRTGTLFSLPSCWSSRESAFLNSVEFDADEQLVRPLSPRTTDFVVMDVLVDDACEDEMDG